MPVQRSRSIGVKLSNETIDQLDQMVASSQVWQSRNALINEAIAHFLFNTAFIEFLVQSALETLKNKPTTA